MSTATTRIATAITASTQRAGPRFCLTSGTTRAYGGRFPRTVCLVLKATLLAAVVAVTLAAFVARSGSATPAEVSTAGPTYYRDVAPILDAKCASCRRLGGIAPFALTTAADAKAHAAGILRMTKAGLMPPWMPGTDSAAIIGRDRRRLTCRRSSQPSPGGARPARPPGTRPPSLRAFGGGGPHRPGHHDHADAAEGVRAARRGRRHRRLPLLPARSQAEAGRVRHRGADQAPAHGNRAPRDPVRGRRCTGDCRHHS